MAPKHESGDAGTPPAEDRPQGEIQGSEPTAAGEVVGGPADQAQPQGRQIRLRLDERNLRTSYANAFRSDATADEVMLYFGLNLVNPVAAQQGNPEIIFQATERIIMSYPMAKRLALTLGQIIRRHEEQFGEIELDINKRRRTNR